MKIISKYKDYYDYLSGIYGIDDKIVLNRTEFFPVNEFSTKIVTFYIAGYSLDGYYDSQNNRWYFGEDLIALDPKPNIKKSKWERRIQINPRRYKYINKNRERCVSILFPTQNKYYHAYPDLIKDPNKINQKYGCPIMCSSGIPDDYIKFPILKDTGIASVLPAEKIYLMLIEWLAPKENIVDNRTNIEKILSAGFDTKTSFRNIK